jgi:hypothetical protein
MEGLIDIIGKLHLENNVGSTKFSCLSDGIQFPKKYSVNANDEIIISYYKIITTTSNSN